METLTFSSAPPNGSGIEVMVHSQTTINSAGSLAAGAVSGLSEVTIAGADHLMLFDATDNALKKGLASDLIEQLTTEQVQDVVGAMVSSNTETGVAVSYEDGDGTLDFVLASAQPTVTSLGTLTTLTVDDITINGSTISRGGSGDLFFDIGGNIQLDADDNGEIRFLDGGTQYATIKKDGNNALFQSIVADGDFIIQGIDGSSFISALTLDMSAAGAATFNSSVNATNLLISGAQGSDGQVLTSTGSGVAWEDAAGGVAGISSSADATAITIGSDEGVTFSAGITSTQPNAFGACSFNDADLSDVGTIFADQYLGDADTNTGIVLNGSDVMTLHTAGTERLRIAADGKVAIGQTDAGNAKLVINGSVGAGSDTAVLDFDGYGTYGADSSQSINFRMGRTGQATDQGAQIRSIFQGGGATAGQTAIGFEFRTVSENTVATSVRFSGTSRRIQFNSDEIPHSNNPVTQAPIVIGPSTSNAITSGLTNSTVLLNRGGELYAVDSSHNNTQITPHNWGLISSGPSEELAWTYYSQRPNPSNSEQIQTINVDMAKVVRKVEDLVGEKLIYTENSDKDGHTFQTIISDIQTTLTNLTTRIEALEG